jgi:hypothetical protein
MRRGGKPDGNQEVIVEALRLAGASVEIISKVGFRCPDLLVGYRRRTFLLEVKSETGELTDGQREWHCDWKGLPVDVVETPREALAAIGAIRRAG